MMELIWRRRRFVLLIPKFEWIPFLYNEFSDRYVSKDIVHNFFHPDLLKCEYSMQLRF